MKLAIKKIETTVGKQVTYSKRRAGLEKKAKELATLCDIDLVLLLFSPAGKLSWINGSKSPPEEVIMRFANLPFQERAKRKVEAMEQLKRVFKKLDHDVNVEEYTRQPMPSQSIEELHQHLQRLQVQYLQLQEKLRVYDSSQTFEEANKLESMLQHRLEEVRLHKQLLESSHRMVPYNEAVRQQLYPEGILPSSVQLDPPTTWEADGHKQQSMLAESNPMFTQRDSSNAMDHMPSSLVEYGNQLQGTSHLLASLKKITYPEGPKREKIGLELDTRCSNSMDYGGEENPTSLSDANRLSMHWPTSSNPGLSSSMISAQQIRSQYLHELDVVGNGSLPRDHGLFRPESSSTW